LAKDVVVDVHVLVDVYVDGFWRIRLRSGPFEGPQSAVYAGNQRILSIPFDFDDETAEPWSGPIV